VVKRYRDLTALDGLDLDVAPGQVLAVVGFNGAGKTTLMRVALGMCRADAGQVTVLGADLASGEPDWSRVGHLIDPQFGYPELTVKENLYAAARLHGLAHGPARAALAAAIDRLALDPWATRRTGTLSAGNRQRLGLAAAMLHKPALLILDEPTSALDPGGVVLLRDLVAELATAGTALLVSSHHFDEVARVADRVSVVHAGRVVGELDPAGQDLERTFFAMVQEADAETAT
jgi:ABC-2 type transport system ATP-binding protein